MYTLFAYPNSYAMTAHAVLEEIGAPYEVRWVQIFSDQVDPDFASASPHARVPALVTPEGTIFETGAVALYLAEHHTDTGLLVPTGAPGRGAFLQWFHYLASTLQPDVMIQFHPELYFPNDEEAQNRFLHASMARLTTVLDVIETLLSDGPYFCGQKRTILDYLFVMQAVWPEIFPGQVEDYPRIHHLISTLLPRPAVARVYKIHMDEKRVPLKADNTEAPNGYGIRR